MEQGSNCCSLTSNQSVFLPFRKSRSEERAEEHLVMPFQKLYVREKIMHEIIHQASTSFSPRDLLQDQPKSAGVATWLKANKGRATFWWTSASLFEGCKIARSILGLMMIAEGGWWVDVPAAHPFCNYPIKDQSIYPGAAHE